MKNCYYIILLLVFVSCGEDHKVAEQEKVILLKSEKYEVYTSKDLFSENLKSWITKWDVFSDKDLLVTFDNNKAEIPLDLYQLAQENYLKQDRLKFRTAEMLEKHTAYVFNLQTRSHVTVKIDSTTYNHFFTIGLDTLFITLDSIE